MLPFRKVLFPVDYSEPCKAVVPYVHDIVQHFSADLTLVHAYGGGALAYTELLAADPKWLEEVKEREAKRLREFASAMFPGMRVETITEDGEAATVIHQVIQHQGADLVMMPTEGRGPVRRFLLGSVTAKVLHDVSAAVWTGVGAALTGHKAGVPYKSIVCALDDSAEAEVVLKAAATLACSYHAQLFLLRAAAVPPSAPEIDFGVYRKDFIDAADLGLKELKARLGVDAPHTVTDTMILDAVRQEVTGRKADLLVVGRGQAQGTFSRAWSLLYPIVRESPCPVLSI